MLKYLFIILKVFILIIGCNLLKNSKKNDFSNVKSIKEYTIYARKGNFHQINEGKRDSLFKINYGMYTIYKNGNPSVRFRNYPKTNIKDKIVWEYDKNGNEIKITKYKSDGTIHSYREHTLDTNFNCIETSFYSGKDKVMIDNYEYDEQGNKIKETSTSLISDFSYRYAYKYEDDNLVAQRYYYKGQIMKSIFVYDESGNKIEEIQNGGKKGYAKLVLKYDKNNNQVEEKKIDSKNTLKWTVNYKYIYDNRGNWTTREHSENGDIKSITEREFEYLN